MFRKGQVLVTAVKRSYSAATVELPIRVTSLSTAPPKIGPAQASGKVIPVELNTARLRATC